MKAENPIGYIVFGIVFSFIGFIFIYKRATLVDAFMASSKMFWEKFGYSPNEKICVLITSIMIPFMGVVFFGCGILSLYRFVAYYLK